MAEATKTHISDPVTASVAYSAETIDVDSSGDTAPRPELTGYELLEVVGHGGMGVVYHGRDLELNREVAIKLLLPKYLPDSVAAERFFNEAQITGQLQHPGIPPVYRVGYQSNGSPFLAMKLVKGRTLQEHLKDRTNWTEDRSRYLAIFEQVCHAVGYAHTHQVIHRDLKPQNIMVGAYGEVLVMDWGLAKVLNDSTTLIAQADVLAEPATEIQSHRGDDVATQAGSLLGTPSYMPPEQAIGAIDEVDAQSDVFGLGAILCVILTGHPPYVGTDPESVRKAAVRANQAEAQARLGDCGAEPELVALCRRCLSADKADRPRNASAVAEAVAAFRAETEERARRAELERVRAESEREAANIKAVADRKRWRAQLALAGMAVVLVAIGGVGAWWAQKQIDDRARLESERNSEKVLADVEKNARSERLQNNARGAIERAAEFRKQWHWRQAEDLLAQVAGQFGPGDDPILATEVAAARRDTQFLERLFEIRMAKAGVDGKYHNEDAPPAYINAFRDYGYDILNDDPVELANRLKATAIWSELLVALDDWAWTASIVNGLQQQGERVWAVTSAATGQNNRPGRFAGELKSASEVLKLVEAMPKDQMTPSLVSFLSSRIGQLGGDAALVSEVGIRNHPNDFWMHFELGWAYWYGKPKRLDLAIGAFRTAVALRPNVPAAQSFLAAATLEKTTQQAKIGNGSASSDIIAKLQAQIETKSDDYYARVQLGSLLFNSRDYSGSAKIFHKLVIDQPEVVDYWQRYGQALQWSNRTQESVAAYRKAVTLDRESARSIGLLGVSLAAANEHEEALRFMLRALNHSNDPQTHLYSQIGNSYEAIGKLPEALEAYRNATRYFALNVWDWRRYSEVAFAAKEYKISADAAREAMRLAPTDPYHPWRLAVALESLGDKVGAAAGHKQDAILSRKANRVENAIVSIHRAIALTPDDATLRHELALMHLDKNDLPAADAAAQEALRLNPNLAPAHALRGDIAQRQRRFADAVTAYEAALRLVPDDLGYLHSRGSNLQFLGRSHEAEAEYRNILRRNPDREPTLLALANLLRLKGDLTGAIDLIREVIRVNPKLPVAYQNLAFLYRANGRLPEAVAAARKAVELFPNDSRTKPTLGFYEKLLATEHAFPAYVAGRKVLEPSDAIAYANHCLQCRPGLFARAYRLYADHGPTSFANTYNAACAAVQFLSGQDVSVSAVSLDEWHVLQGRARDWLTNGMIDINKRLAETNSQGLGQARTDLQQYLVDKDLAAVREPAQLALMPDPGERERWERFWSDVRRSADAAGIVFREVSPNPREKR